MKNTYVSKGAIFPLGEQFKSEYFTGRVYLSWHIAIEVRPDLGGSTWLEPVDREEYAKLK